MNIEEKFWETIPTNFQLNVGNILMKDVFYKNESPMKERLLILTTQAIILVKQEKLKKYIPLDFDTNFEVLREPKQQNEETLGKMTGLKLFRNNVSYHISANTQILGKWKAILSKRINQYGFHDLFKVYKKIGKGSFASVYLAERIEDGLSVAVKAFNKEALYAEERGKEAIINEITCMRIVNHKNLITLHEVYETKNSLYVILELLEGGNLYEEMKSKQFMQGKEIQQVIFGLLKGIRHLHNLNIMHRDLKLENILFRKPNVYDSLIIADFGLATNADAIPYIYCRCGTPGYVAPEVINERNMKAKHNVVCDIYSIGLIFYIMLTGKPAFPAKSYSQLVKQNREAKIDFKIKEFQSVPHAAIDLLAQMLEKDPNKRITANQALEHIYLKEFDPNSEKEIEMDDEGMNMMERMRRLNEESAKFDMVRINSLVNSPMKSPALHPTNQLKHQPGNVDPDEFMVMRTPVMTGRVSSIQSLKIFQFQQLFNIDSPAEQEQFQKGQAALSQFNSPGLQMKKLPDQKKNIQQQSLYKYALKNSQLGKMNEKLQEQQQKQSKVKSVASNLNSNI